MKNVYLFDANGNFSGFKSVAEDYQPAAGETAVAIPQPNVMPVKWTGSAWRNATADEAAAYQKQMVADHPAPAPIAPSGPSQDAQAVNALGLQLAQIKANQAAMTTAMDALGMTVATIKAAQATPTTTTPTATN